MTALTAARRSGVVAALVVVLASLLTFQSARPAEALTAEQVVPRSVVVTRAAATAAGFTPAGAAISLGIMGCILWCDDLFDWGTSFIGGTSSRDTTGMLLPLEIDLRTSPAPGSGPATGGIFTVRGRNQGQSVSLLVSRNCKDLTTGAVTDAGNFSTPTWTSVGVGGVWNNTYYTHQLSPSPLCAAGSALVRLQVRFTGVSNGKIAYAYWNSDTAATSQGPFQATASCRTPAGATATATSPQVNTASAITAPDCEAVLPGSYRDGLKVTQRQPDMSFQPVVDVGLDLAAYPACQTEATPCVRRWSTPTQLDPSICKWGPYAMPDSDCEDLGARPTYAEPSPASPAPSPASTAGPQTAPGQAPPAGQPDPWDPAAVPAADGTSTTLNPDGSTTVTTRTTAADGTVTVRTTTTYPDGSKTVTTRTVPPTGIAPAPTVVRVPAPLGEGTTFDPDGENCIAGAFSLNPVDWVYVPVKCAVTWAFQVKPATRSKLAGLKDLAASKPPVSLVAGASSFAAPFADIGQTCPAWNVKVGPLTQNVVCGQGYTERLHDWRNLTGSALLALAVMPFLWRIWHAGLPVLNVSPHR